MHCPFCRHADSRVVDSRTSDDGASIRRRRQCPQCQRRFTTIETASRLSPGHLGSLVPVGDADSLARAIERALDAPSDPAPRRARARDFSVDRVVPRYLEALLPRATRETNAASWSATAG